MSGQLTKSRADGSLGTTAQCLDLLGALSYLAIVSLVPASLLLICVYSMFMGPRGMTRGSIGVLVSW